MQVNGLGSGYTGISMFPIQRSVPVHSGTSGVSDVQTQVNQAKELMLKTLEFAFYKQQDMNLKLVRIAGQLYQGQNIDTSV
ncbi:MAG: hypothetical protein WHS64_04845 [Fervidobacterium sp.]|uniref:Uncharacterized protein n=1 Tax=Fervidobacterium gondwanense DSM 13020 TaxID=1121883 RepID=A0A1M7TCG5_FERGO|nr:hypothetical protein [Fervidobacterium gondwanense]UXF01748.1 hypothetical protein IB67_09540 [Fervidobacterium riparium]SHN68415.1 hypothetical protein SAMN02745226_01833 [Fervidobacterium gondwanense DSM 13020]